MKTNNIYMVGALLGSSILIGACSEDDFASYSELTVDKSEIFIKMENEIPKDSVYITSGNGNYKISVADENVATAVLDGTKVVFTGLKNGETTATIMDWTKHSSVITIRVKEDFELTLDKSELVMVKGVNDSELVSIKTGNGGYQVKSSDETIAMASLTDEGKIEVLAVGTGVASITVTDADGKEAVLTVIVADENLELEEIPEGTTLGVNQVLEVKILSGNGEYKAVCTDEKIATAEVADNDVVKITGHAEGKATITVTDKAGLSVNMDVVVENKLVVEEKTVDLLVIGESKEIGISGGSGDYSCVAPEAVEATVSGSKLKIKGLSKAYNQTVELKDNQTGATFSIKVVLVDVPYLETQEMRYFINGQFSSGTKNNGSITWNDKGYRREYVSIGKKPNFLGSGGEDGYRLYFTHKPDGSNGLVEGEVYDFDEIEKYANAPAISGEISDIRVDKVIDSTPEDNNSADWVWVSFQQSGLDTRSYMVVQNK